MNKIDVDFGSLARSVASLIRKAEAQLDSGEAMKFSQAALNAVHALTALAQFQDLKKG